MTTTANLPVTTCQYAGQNWWQAPGNCVSHALNEWSKQWHRAANVTITVTLDPDSRVQTVTVTGEAA